MNLADKKYPLPTYVEEYLKSLHAHRERVLKAGLGVVGFIPDSRLVQHDISKFSPDEWPHYALKFFGPEDQRDTPVAKARFSQAFLHHIRNNDHHWQHWVIPHGRPVRMEDVCVREMVADWLSFGCVEELDGYLIAHVHKMLLHVDTKACLVEVLQDIGCSLEVIAILKGNDEQN